jgi:hypothetical protein
VFLTFPYDSFILLHTLNGHFSANLTWRVFRSFKKKFQKKQKSSEYFENIFEILKKKNRNRKKEQSNDLVWKASGDWMEKLDWMKTMSHRWMVGWMPLCRWTEN